jgi:hypothetical protein
VRRSANWTFVLAPSQSFWVFVCRNFVQPRLLNKAGVRYC